MIKKIFFSFIFFTIYLYIMDLRLTQGGTRIKLNIKSVEIVVHL